MKNQQELKIQLLRSAPWLRNIRASANRLCDTVCFLSRGVRYAPIVPYLYIDGWLSYSEAIALYESARSLKAESPIVVEIGSWQGKSSVVLARAIKVKRQSVLYCVDPFNATNNGVQDPTFVQRTRRMDRSLLDTFVKNMRTNGVYDVIRILHGMSHDFAGSFAEKIDLLYIDGNHEYDAVRRDYEEWAPHLKRGGIIAFHDVVRSESGTCQGPWMVVKERIHQNRAWTEKRLVDSLYIARKAD